MMGGSGGGGRMKDLWIGQRGGWEGVMRVEKMVE